MNKLTSLGMSTLGLAAMAIVPVLALIAAQPNSSLSLPLEVSLTDRFDDSFVNGPGGINSLTDDFDDSFVNGPGGLNS